MGTFSLTHWLVVLAIVLILFGAGRIPSAMGDLARGIRAFRTGMREDKPIEGGRREAGRSAAGLISWRGSRLRLQHARAPRAHAAARGESDLWSKRSRRAAAA